jgi:hypothetical protein
LGVKIKVVTIIERARAFSRIFVHDGTKTVIQIFFPHHAKQHAKMIFSQNKPAKQETQKNKTIGVFSSSCAFQRRVARLLVPEIDDGRARPRITTNFF